MTQELDHPALKKYFWDHTEKASDAFKFKRLVEYASFPDLIAVPFDFIKRNIDSVNIERLRTSEVRKEFVGRMKSVIHRCKSWDDAVFIISGLK